MIHPMKNTARFFILPAAASGVCFAAFNVPWYTLDGGGGKSSGTANGGTVFTLSGTVGQFDATASQASGGIFSLNGGFWAQVLAEPELDKPALTISRLPNGDASIQWASDAEGWQMETSTDLTMWTPYGSTINSAGSATIPYNSSIPRMFFRLRQP